MANVSHASLTGSNLHEPKGIATATSGTVYIADGAGSGSWGSASGTAVTGQIADFATPVAPAGWLECAGQTLNKAAFPNLYTALTIQKTGTTTLGSNIITNLTSIGDIRVGYHIAGTGIPAGANVVTSIGSTQIVMDDNASASGTVTIWFSPWPISTTTVTIPDTTTAGRYRRGHSVANGFFIGQTQGQQFQDHQHNVSGTIATDTQGAHGHNITVNANATGISLSNNTAVLRVIAGPSQVSGSGLLANTSDLVLSDPTHAHTASADVQGSHAHNANININSNTSFGASAGTETRPITLVVMTCIKT